MDMTKKEAAVKSVNEQPVEPGPLRETLKLQHQNLDHDFHGSEHSYEESAEEENNQPQKYIPKSSSRSVYHPPKEEKNADENNEH